MSEEAPPGVEIMSWIYTHNNPYYPKDNRPLIWAWDIETGKKIREFKMKEPDKEYVQADPEFIPSLVTHAENVAIAQQAGLTLLSRVLGAHSAIFAPEEPHLITPIAHLGMYANVDKAPVAVALVEVYLHELAFCGVGL